MYAVFSVCAVCIEGGETVGTDCTVRNACTICVAHLAPVLHVQQVAKKQSELICIGGAHLLHVNIALADRKDETINNHLASITR